MKKLLLLSSFLMAAATDTGADNGGGKQPSPPAGGTNDKAPAPPEKAKPEKMVTARVECESLGEGADHYLKGETFKTTESRAKALGALVRIEN